MLTSVVNQSSHYFRVLTHSGPMQWCAPVVMYNLRGGGREERRRNGRKERREGGREGGGWIEEGEEGGRGWIEEGQTS